MRHRALRTAAILCPQEALDRVIREEGYLVTSDGGSDCSLKQCTYGSFVAKEIEEMGLPLPHSDLLALSTMHFPSYARALWRHHRAGECNGYKGRLLLLLLEMSLKEISGTDSDLVLSILNEMSALQLPRSILSGCESIASFKKRSPTSDFASLEDSKDVLSRVLKKVVKGTLKELHQKVGSEAILPSDSCVLQTIQRLGQLLTNLEGMEAHLLEFIQELLDLIVEAEYISTKDGKTTLKTDLQDESEREITGGDKKLSDGLANVAIDGICCLEDGHTKRSLLGKLAGSQLGRKAIDGKVLTTRSNVHGTTSDANTLRGMASQQSLSMDDGDVEHITADVDEQM